ncbi:hypothetical protein KJ641_04575 [Patescibacteria group bacterium]|nr:hypothetical protein [Patescibacteria group bacterium]
MEKKLREQLKSLKNENGRLNADQNWVSKNRGDLMRQITSQVSSKSKETIETAGVISEIWQIFIPASLRMMTRPAITTLLVVVVSVAGWSASVGASSGSLPGDAFYGVKLAAEKTKMVVGGLVGGSEKKAELLNKAAKTRANETKALVEENKMDKVEKTLESLKKSVTEAHKNLEEVSKKEPEKAAKVAGGISDSAETISNTLKEALAGTNNIEVSGQIVDTKKEVTDKGIGAVSSVLQKKENGELNEVTDKEMGELVKKAIENLTDDTEEMGAQTDELERVLGDQTSQVIINISSSTISKVVSSTVKVSVSTTAVTNSSTPVGEDASLKDVKAVSEVVIQDLVDAKGLAEGGQLVEALVKALEVNKDVNNITKSVKPVVVEETRKLIESEVVEQTSAGDVVSTSTTTVETTTTKTITQ